MFNLDNIPLDDKETYDLISEGKTKGVFQAESSLCQHYIKMIKPRNISDLSDVIAIIRPGALQQADEYIAVRNKEKEVSYLDNRLEPILNPTNGIILYQEQTIKIAEVLGGFTEIEADGLRKAIGKKDMDKMKSLRPKFVDGCIKNGVKKENAEHLMDIIIESGNYSFNKAHSYSYAINMYKSAYLKTHYPMAFFLGLLQCARMKQDPMEEICQLYYDMKYFDIKLLPPKILDLHEDFEIMGENEISFGINHVKRMGETGYKALSKLAGCKTWRDFLIEASRQGTNSAKVEAAILAGVLDEYNTPRTKMMEEYKLLKELSTAQQKKMFEFIDANPGVQYKSLSALILSIFQDQKRLKPSEEVLLLCDKLVKNEYNDSNLFKDINERAYFGINLTSNRVNDFGKIAKNKCADIVEADEGNFEVCAIIEKIKIKKTKRGEDMANISFSDSSGCIENGLIFQKALDKARNDRFLLQKECSEVVIIRGYKKLEKDCFFINDIKSIF